MPRRPTAPKKTTRRPAAKKRPAAKRVPARRPAPAKRAKGGLSAQLVRPDAALAAVVGRGPMARTEVTKKLWGYIKRYNLQRASDRTIIEADAKLRAVFGKGSVGMLELPKIVSRHLA